MRTKLNEGVVVSIEFLSPLRRKKTQISSMDKVVGILEGY